MDFGMVISCQFRMLLYVLFGTRGGLLPLMRVWFRETFDRSGPPFRDQQCCLVRGKLDFLTQLGLREIDPVDDGGQLAGQADPNGHLEVWRSWQPFPRHW
jgi:hypothetical protein